MSPVCLFHLVNNCPLERAWRGFGDPSPLQMTRWCLMASRKRRKALCCGDSFLTQFFLTLLNFSPVIFPGSQCRYLLWFCPYYMPRAKITHNATLARIYLWNRARGLHFDPVSKLFLSSSPRKSSRCNRKVVPCWSWVVCGSVGQDAVYNVCHKPSGSNPRVSSLISF